MKFLTNLWKLLRLLSQCEIKLAASQYGEDVSLHINNSTLVFKANGDLEVSAGRILSSRYKYSFHNCSDEFIQSVLQPDKVISLRDYLSKKEMEVEACPLAQ